MADDKVVKVGYHMEMRGRSIRTLADAVDPGDAVNLGQLEDAIDAIEIPPGGGPGAGYLFQNHAFDDPYVYIGYEHPGGGWFIKRRTVASNVWARADGVSGYLASWGNRGSLPYA